LLCISILPVRREILLGILHCDLIGFHTYDYARHFLSSCTRVLGIPTLPNGLEFEGRYAHVGTYPIGIDPGQFVDVSLIIRCTKRQVSNLYAYRVWKSLRSKRALPHSNNDSMELKSLLELIAWITSRVFRKNFML
jgi:trehalose-6-phosphate synthase